MLSFNGYIKSYKIKHHNKITISKISLKDRQAQPHKRTQRFILGNPHGEENPAKLPMYKMYKRQPKTIVLLLLFSLSLSLLCTTQVSECFVQIRT